MTFHSSTEALAPSANSLAQVRASLQENRYEAARAQAYELLQASPGNIEAGALLAEALLGLNCLTEALPLLQTLTRLRPNDVGIHYHLGLCLQRQRDFVRAARALTRAYQLDNRQARVVVELANCLLRLKMKPEALHIGLSALKLMPDNASLHAFVANLYREFGCRAETLKHFQLAIALEPGNASYRYLFGNALMDFEDYQQACEVLEQHRVMTNEGVTLLASAYLMRGDDERARGLVREAALSAETIEELSRLLFLLTQVNDHGVSYVGVARRFDQAISQGQTVRTAWAPVSPSENLRIGFVSGDFRHHPVGLFIKHLIPLLGAHNIHAIAYSNSVVCDATTEQLRGDFNEWQDIAHLNTEQVCRIIEEDGVRILVDLSGHTRDNRLDVFACKPAPLQVTWLGYGASTGLSTMDYLLADPVSVPAGTESEYSERPWRLPDTRMCYAVPDIAPAVSDTPALHAKRITFGSFQSLRKVGTAVLDCWASVLRAVPDAHFRWQCRPFADPASRQRVLDLFSARGVEGTRITLLPASNWASYLASHREVDILLDSFPFTGGTTTCDALWMGVPTLTLYGNTLIARQGTSLLTAAGLEQWIAIDVQEYVQKARMYASDIPALNSLRQSLRDRLRDSTLFDASKFVAQLATAFHAMHEQWLADMPANE